MKTNRSKSSVFVIHHAMPNANARKKIVPPKPEPLCAGFWEELVRYFTWRCCGTRTGDGRRGAASVRVVAGGPDICDIASPGESDDATAPQFEQNDNLSDDRRPQFWHSMTAS